MGTILSALYNIKLVSLHNNPVSTIILFFAE